MRRQSIIRNVIKGEMAEIWELFSTAEKNEMLGHFEVKSFKKNSIIYNEGDNAAYLMCLIRGKVKISKEGVGGRSQIIRLVRPLQYFGYQTYFAGLPHTGNAIAFEQSMVAFLPLEILEQYMLRNSKLAYFFIKEIAKDLISAENNVVSLTQKHIRGRLAESLFTIKEFFGLTPEGYIDARFSREELANLSNMTTSNAIRTLSAFAKEGLVEINGRYIKIINEDKISKISKFGW